MIILVLGARSMQLGGQQLASGSANHVESLLQEVHIL